MSDATNNGNKTLSHAQNETRNIEIEVDRKLECGARMSAESVQPKHDQESHSHRQPCNAPHHRAPPAHLFP